MKRRDFLKSSFIGLGFTAIFGKATGILGQVAKAADAAIALLKDASITKQKYIHSVNAEDKAVTEFVAAITKKKMAKYPGKIPMCINCKQFKKPNGDYGTCAMVGAKGKKADDWVYKDGLCKVYMANAKVLKA